MDAERATHLLYKLKIYLNKGNIEKANDMEVELLGVLVTAPNYEEYGDKVEDILYEYRDLMLEGRKDEVGELELEILDYFHLMED